MFIYNTIGSINLRKSQWTKFACSINLIVYLLFVFRLPVTSSLDSTSAQTIDPSRLGIVSVLDHTNFEVSRDALTLLRSMRLYGGLLNLADFLFYIPLRKDSTFIDNTGLIKQLSAMGAEVIFITQVDPSLPKTLNKITALKSSCDSFRYDYILWLDADIVVFGDPITRMELQKHSYPGQIDCVPDFYSYLRRFPHVNSSEILWNPTLPYWQLLGDGEIAPHGTCNTGVLFFDILSLQKFLDILPRAIVEVDELNMHKNDRFLDSLYFVAALNMGGIRANIVSYDLNYMAFFEQEIYEEKCIVNDIIFAHFLHDTTMFCDYVSHRNPSCSCKVRFLKSNIL